MHFKQCLLCYYAILVGVGSWRFSGSLIIYNIARQRGTTVLSLSLRNVWVPHVFVTVPNSGYPLSSCILSDMFKYRGANFSLKLWHREWTPCLNFKVKVCISRTYLANIFFLPYLPSLLSHDNSSRRLLFPSPVFILQLHSRQQMVVEIMSRGKQPELSFKLLPLNFMVLSYIVLAPSATVNVYKTFKICLWSCNSRVCYL